MMRQLISEFFWYATFLFGILFLSIKLYKVVFSKNSTTKILLFSIVTTIILLFFFIRVNIYWTFVTYLLFSIRVSFFCLFFLFLWWAFLLFFQVEESRTFRICESDYWLPPSSGYDINCSLRFICNLFISRT